MNRFLLAVVALFAVASVSPARAEVIAASFTPVAVPYQVDLSASTAFALWGTGNNGSTDANLTGGLDGLISPALLNFTNGNPTAGRGYASPAFWNYRVSGTQVYGAIHHLTDAYSPVGEGFNLYLHPADTQTTFTVWVRSSNSTGSVTVTSFVDPSYTSTFDLESNEYGYVSVTSANQFDTLVVALRSTGGSAGFNGPNVLLGGVTADIVPVDEPRLSVIAALLAVPLAAGRVIRRRSNHAG